MDKSLALNDFVRLTRRVHAVLFVLAIVLAILVGVHLHEAVQNAGLLARMLVPPLIAIAIAAGLITAWAAIIRAVAFSTARSHLANLGFAAFVTLIGLTISSWSVASLIGGSLAQRAERLEAVAEAREAEAKLRARTGDEALLVGQVHDLRARFEQARNDSIMGRLFGIKGNGVIAQLLFGERDRAGEIAADLERALDDRSRALEAARDALEAAEVADPEHFPEHFAEARRELDRAATVQLARIAVRVGGLRVPDHPDAPVLRGPIDRLVAEAKRLDRERAEVTVRALQQVPDYVAVVLQPGAAAFGWATAIAADLIPVILISLLLHARYRLNGDDDDPPGTAVISEVPASPLPGGPRPVRLAHGTASALAPAPTTAEG